MTRFLCFGFVAALAVHGQTAPKGGGPTAPTTTPTLSPSRTTAPTQDPTQSPRSTVFISGKVVLDDGTPPPEPVAIERLCGPTRRIEARTDLKGNFSFQLGFGATNTEQLSDSSIESMPGRSPMGSSSGGAGAVLGNSNNRLDSPNSLMGCELRAALPGYRSSTINLSRQGQFDNTDVGMIVLKRLAGREGDTISMTNALVPKDAKKAYDKARVSLAKGNTAEARKEFNRAVDLYPAYASAWAQLGNLQMDANDSGAARKSFLKALDSDPKYLPPYERLAVLAMRERNWDDVVDKTDRLIRLNAYDFPQAYYYNALANLNLNKPEAAEKSARQALKQDPQKFARAGYVLGLALAQIGQFAESAGYLRTYLGQNPTPNETELLRTQLPDIEKRATQQTAREQQQQ